MRGRKRRVGYDPWKRCVDLVAALVIIVLTAPVMGAVALLVRATSPGGAVFKGERVGRHGRIFEMLKFRTMVSGAERMGPASVSTTDTRVTPIGRVLRRYKLDELPQFFNVLRGDMSLVGPRPQVPWAVDAYDVEALRLLEVRPGVTDWASIRFRNEGELLEGADDPDAYYFEHIEPEKIRLGLEYVERRSLRVDISILLSTIATVFGADDGEAHP